MSTGFDIQDGVLINYSGDKTEITIPSGVVEIGEKAFEENKKITEVVIPDSVTKIGSNAFEKCIKLKVVTFSKNLQEIGYKAFNGCKALKEIDLPDTLKELGSGCFVNCDKLTKISCESKALEVDSNPFESYGEKTPAGIADKDGFIILAGILYCYVGEKKKINVPDGVTHIVGNLFRPYLREKSLIEEVILPSSVKYIGDNAFRDCEKLKSVSMPTGVQIGLHAFAGCKSLMDENGFFVHDGVACAYCGDSERVVVPIGTKVISAQLFANDHELNKGNKNIQEVVLPEGLEVIGNQAFDRCSLLGKINIPISVHTIGAAAFRNCEHLKEIDIPESVDNIGDGILMGCRGLADKNGFVIAKNTVQAFYGAERNVVIPEGITAIAAGAFAKSGIISVKLPVTLRRLESAFEGCDLLEKIIIPEGVTVIKNRTFLGCHKISKVVLPSTIESIGDSAFSYCENLSEIDLPVGLVSIGNSAFYGCKSLESIEIPANVKVLKYDSFANCVKLSQIKLSEGLEIIDNCVFKGCESLESIKIPSTVKKIGYDAFAGCKSLMDVSFFSNNTVIDDSSFFDCPKLKDKSGFTIINGTLYKYEGKGGSVAVPEGVIEIAENVFREGESRARRSWVTYRKEGFLKAVTLPSTLKTIGNHAFDGCKGLSEITIPSQVKSIGTEAFRECKKLQVVNLSAELERIGNLAFYGCDALKTVNIPSSVSFIGEDAFRCCKNLKEISTEDGNDTYSSMNGILTNKSGDTIVFVPAGKKLSEYTIPSNIKTISSHAFIDCEVLKKIIIPSHVENVGDEAFPRSSWGSKSNLTEIEVDPKAGSGTIGVEVFDIYNGVKPIVYPKLPVTFVKEAKTQVSLALGFCLNPEQYEGEYLELYKKYVTSHEKTLIRKAASLKLKGIEEYFSGAKTAKVSKSKVTVGNDGGQAVFSGYKPDLSIKKPSELVKVEILEEVVQKGTLQDLIDVLETYKNFEMTARALGLAARYRGVEFVETLIEHGATFKYKSEAALQRKYKMDQSTASGCYSTEYYLMVVPEKLDLSTNKWGETAYGYSAMCGVPNMNISSDMVPLSLENRIEVVKKLAENKKSGISLDEILFWALTTDELDFADALIEMGVDLQKTPPTYYTSWGAVPVYLDMVTSAPQSVYWNSYVSSIAALKETSVQPVLERFGKLAAAAGKQIVVSQKMFDEVKWSDGSLSYVIKNADMSKVNQKKALETAVSTKSLGALEIMAEAGWLTNTKKREGLIDFARNNKYKDALAWLMDYKNKTVDVAKEEAKEEAQMFKELTEDPNSVSALKKKWSYIKLSKGTLQITSYKGDDEDVEIPAMIGKASVTSIAKEAFSIFKQGIKNEASRKAIKTVVVPEGVTEIGEEAFRGCESIETIKLPDTIKKISEFAFARCSKLKTINLPSKVKVEKDVFSGCKTLTNATGLIIVGDTLYDFYGLNTSEPTLVVPEGVTKIAPYALTANLSSTRPSHLKEVVLPEGLVEIGEGAFSEVHLEKVVIPSTVKKIGKKAFYGCYLKSIDLPEGLNTLGESAFESNSFKELRIPKSLKDLPSKAFYECSELRDAYIPDTVNKIGDTLFGEKEGWRKVEGLYVHTPSGSVAETYMKDFGGIFVSNDYTE